MIKSKFSFRYSFIFLGICAVLSYGMFFVNFAESAPATQSKNWQSIASSSDGKKVVAVVNGGSIYTSNDGGINWTQRTSDATRSWFSVASDSTGTKLVAVVNGGGIYKSTDGGVTWKLTNAPTKEWRSVASNSDGSQFVAGGYGNPIYTSNDGGLTWKARTSDKYVYSIASDVTGAKLASTEFNGNILMSIDRGITWVPKDSVRKWTSVTSSSDGEKLVAVEMGGKIYTSSNRGSSWVAKTSAGVRNWSSVSSSADGEIIVATATSGTSPMTGEIYVSPDNGETWTSKSSQTSWKDVVMNSEGTSFVAVGYGSSEISETFAITVNKINIPSGYNILLYKDYNTGPSFTSGEKFSKGTTVNIVAYVTDGSKASWTGCDSTTPGDGGQSVCRINNLNENKTLTVSGPVIE